MKELTLKQIINKLRCIFSKLTELEQRTFEQVNADWNAVSGVAEILNKPDLDLKADLVLGKVPSSQLPSYVDDVEEYSDFLSLPITGEQGKIYVTLDTNLTYRWSGSSYIEISSGGGGGITPVVDTRANILNLISTSSLIPGNTYIITDADTALYGGTRIMLKAISTNQLSLEGSGLFYTPKYTLNSPRNGYGVWNKNMLGNFNSTVGTFVIGETVTANNGATAKFKELGYLEFVSGDWGAATSITGDSSNATSNVFSFTSPSYNIGDKVHWGGKTWVNVNGNVGDSSDKYTLNSEWSVIPFNSTDYNVHIDDIKYYFENDVILYRKDRYGNVVDLSYKAFTNLQSSHGNPIKDFQWGCMGYTDQNGIQGNKIIDSYFETINTNAWYIWGNTIKNLSYVKNNVFEKKSHFSYNELDDNSYVYNNILATIYNSSIDSNILKQNSSIDSNVICITSGTSSITKNIIEIQSVLSSNRIQSFGYISRNNITNLSMLYGNVLTGGGSSTSIGSNLIIKSSLNYNVLGIDSFINGNSIFSESTINSCTLSSSNINNNSLYFSKLDLTTSGTLTSKSISLVTFDNTRFTAYPNISAATRIFATTYPRRVFLREGGNLRLSYTTSLDALTTVAITA